MTAPELFRRAVELRLRLEPAGDKLAVLPKGKCPGDFAQVLRDNKQTLLAWLTNPTCPGWQSVPPSDVALNPLPPRPSPADARRVMDYIVRQIGDRPGALCEWCLTREAAYWDAFHWPDQVCSYAAARDAVCLQLQQDEAAVLELLNTFDELAQKGMKPALRGLLGPRSPGCHSGSWAAGRSSGSDQSHR